MHEADESRSPALAELRGRLEEARARARLNQTELAGKAGLGRATVGKILASGGGVPSAKTVAYLARALKLPVGELLELRRTAVEEADGHPSTCRGRGVRSRNGSRTSWKSTLLVRAPSRPGSEPYPDT
ncbi:helix-turn-helix transcriptional regulator [Streptomyces sp. NPDC006476]|uniref:helix-turn-helix transcriptional regulator n=1 Tax=Streptomyces sp. NPDC006476 TaxID=3157175 RepID=UPI0033B23CFD